MKIGWPSHPIIDGIANALNSIGITNHPILDAVAASLPKSQVGNGNTQQQAHDSAAINNPQIGGPTVKVDLVTTSEESESEPEPQAITMALPGGVDPADVTLPSGGAEGPGGDGTTGDLGGAPTKPKGPHFGQSGHPIKKTLKKIHDAAQPKHKPPTAGGTGSSGGSGGPWPIS